MSRNRAVVSASSSTDRTLAARPVLGIDFGGSTVKSVVIDDGGVTKWRVARDKPVEDMLPALVTRALDGHGIEAVGVGLAGLVDHDRGLFVWGPHISETDIDVAGLLEPLIGAFAIDNDANCAAYGEWVDGAASGHRVALTISLGTGIGGGLVVDGSIVRGSGFAGEVGHMRVGSADLVCQCGRSGCWETAVSGRQLGLAAQRLGLRPEAEALVEAAGNGSSAAREELWLAGEWLGVGITDLILTLDPDVVVIAGGVSGAGELILDAARKQIASSLPGREHRPDIPVVMSTHGRWAAAVGAAHLVAEHPGLR